MLAHEITRRIRLGRSGRTLVATPVFDAYWRFAAERQAIFHKRVQGQPPPWTNDDVLANHRFTNAYRAADRVSQYLIRNVIYSGEQSNPANLLFPSATNADPAQLRRQSARISRLLRILRDHGIIRKISKTHRYRLSSCGQLLVAALFATRSASIKQLIANAA